MKYRCTQCPWTGNHFKITNNNVGLVNVGCPDCGWQIKVVPPEPPPKSSIQSVSTYDDQSRWRHARGCKWIAVRLTDGDTFKARVMTGTAEGLKRILDRVTTPYEMRTRPKGCDHSCNADCECHCHD